ncbi:MAG: hypothetical protein HY275_02420 [Gemmatimonadetes bacterium]|nr:hypothetical protein [Gemmatimonadota bacterium]
MRRRDGAHAPDRTVLEENMRRTFRYIMTGGAFLGYRLKFDADGDGRISRAEFEADPTGYRRRGLQATPFSAFDHDGDGFFTEDEMSFLTRPYLDAIDRENFALLDRWAATAAAVSTPAGWFADHFAHQELWSYLATLTVPVGVFQGGMDAMVSIDALRRLQQRARAAGRTNIAFRYYPRLDHTLDIGLYFVRSQLPQGHADIFAYIDSIAVGVERAGERSTTGRVPR